MCLAIYKPAGTQLDWDALANGFQSNPHGAGFAVVNEGVLTVHKGFFNFDAFREAYAPLSHLQAAIHFRWATHGLRDYSNCHPFHITAELAVIHNGVLDIACDVEKDMSDTWHFVHHILKPLAERDRDFFADPVYRFLGESTISGSKMVFLRSDGVFDIWNEKEGVWIGDAWFSNRSHESVRTVGFTSAAERVRAWYRDDADDVLIRGDSVPTSIEEVDDFSDEYDPDSSDHYHDLTDRDQMVYERLCEQGWDVSTLDDYIEAHGMNSLHELAARLEKESV